MVINYPGSLDNFTNPTSASPINSPSHADQHSNANDAIEALEAKVGANSSAVTTSHDYKIAQLESLVTSAVAGAKSIYQDVRNQSGSNFVKATPVYISGSEGSSGKMLISAASNASEATSSKTMGLTTSAISNNSNGQIISEGILEGIDTTGAVDGDPVWLGVNGVKIYGYGSIPSAPAHLVFLGIVIRGGQANTGSMYVKIQNGFELQEIHNVELSSLINGNILAYDSSTSTWKNTNTLQSISSTVPLVIKGATSQTANLQEWQNSSGTVLSNITYFGGARLYDLGIKGSPAGIGWAYFGNDNTSTKNVVVRGFTSQTANLQEWQNSAGTALVSVQSNGQVNFQGAYIDQYGQIVTNTTLYANNVYHNLNYWQLKNDGSANFNSQSTTVIPLTVKGAASQTADLQQWQNSAGTVLANVDASGNIYTSSTTIWAGYNRAANGAALYNFTTVAGATYAQAAITRESGFNGNLVIGQQGTGAVLVQNGSAAAIGLIVKGTASQTANLQEWQNSAGTVLTTIDSSGRFVIGRGTQLASAILTIQGNTSTYSPDNTSALANRIIFLRGNTGGNLMALSSKGDTAQGVAALVITNGGFSTEITGFGYNGNIYTNIQSASTVGLTVKAAASQSANLQEWQDSAGTVIAKVNNNGVLHTFAAVYTPYIQPASPTGVNAFIALDNTTVLVDGWSASTVKLTVKGYASQTANLQEWKNSAGTVLSSISSGGVVFGRGLSVSTPTNTTNAGTYYNAAGTPVFNVDTSLNAINIGGGLSGVANNFASTWGYDSGLNAGYMTFTTGALGSDSLAIRRTNHVASGDYTISTLGNFRLSTASGKNFNFNNGNIGIATTTIGTNNKIIVNPYSTVDNLATVQINTNASTNKGLVVQGIVSQTANLQEWQNSAGIVLASVSADGFLNTPLITQTGANAYITFGSGGNPGFIVTGGAAVPLARFLSGNAASIALQVRGATSQTANLQEWQASDGTVYGRFNAFGSLYVSNNIEGGTAQFGNTGFADTTSVVLKVKGVSSQTADLQQWQNSAGTVLTKVTSSGSLFVNSTGTSNDPLTVQVNSITRFRIDPYSSTLALLLTVGKTDSIIAGTTAGIYALNASTVGLIVKGFASQTANLQEWQNSSGTVLAKVTAAGDINIDISQGGTFHAQASGGQVGDYNLIKMSQVSTQKTTLLTTVVSGGDTEFSVKTLIGTLTTTLKINKDSLVGIGKNNTSPLAQIDVRPQSASTIGAIIRGAASQTANLQEWQDSSGTVLVSINADGSSNFNNIMQVKETWGGVALSVSALLGQSNPIQGWYTIDYNGDNKTEVAKIDINGQLAVKSVIGNTSSTISVNTATTVDTVALSSFTTIEYTLSIKQGSKIRSSKVLVHTDGTSVDSTEYGIIEMGGGITGILVVASVSSTNSILQVTITDAATTNATVKLIKTML